MRTLAASVLLVSILCLPSPAAQWAEVTSNNSKLAVDDQSCTLTVSGQTRFEYRHSAVPFKPYVKLFTSPSGVNVLRDAPHDHLHHHALMFAIAADGVDFWAETPTSGKQISRGIQNPTISTWNDTGVAQFNENLQWVSPENKPILSEERIIQIHLQPNLKASLLTWQTTLRPAGDEAKLSGSHYFGLGVRFPESMDKTGKWIYPAKQSEPVVVRGDERLIRATWCAYAASADGKPITIALFDSPRNLRHPAHWFTMREPFAYISATLNLWKEPYTLKASEPLTLKYGVAVWDGTIQRAEIDRVYQQWLKLSRESNR